MTLLGIFDCYLTLALSQAEMTGPKNNMIEKPMKRIANIRTHRILYHLNMRKLVKISAYRCSFEQNGDGLDIGLGLTPF